MRYATTTSRLKLRAATLALAAVLTLSAVLVDAGSAAAGVWMRPSCMSGGTPEGWSGFSSGSISVGSNNIATCTAAPGGQSPLTAFLAATQPVGVGTQEGIVYTPPPGSTLAGGRLFVTLNGSGYGTNTSGVAAIYSPDYAYDGSNVVAQCAHGQAACYVYGQVYAYTGEITLPANRGGRLYLAASCGGAFAGTSCDSGGIVDTAGGPAVWARVSVFNSNLLLASTAVPTASDFAGSLLTPAAHGTAALSFTAAESSGPGIHSVTVAIDANNVYSGTPNTNAGNCVPLGTDAATGALMFATQQPCPLSHHLDLTVPTTALRDGEHELKISVTDAAKNTQTVLRRTITTDNRTTPSSGLGSDAPPIADPGAPGMAGSSAPDPLYANVLDPATQRLLRAPVRRSYRRSAITVAGTLRTSAGLPAPAVGVVLLGRNAGVGEWAVLAHSTANAAGHWVLIAPRGPSRILAIAYGAHPSATGPGVVTIRQIVTPTVSLTVTARGLGRLRFLGRMTIKPLGTPRPLVVIQARKGRKWQTVGDPVRVDASGAFTLSYSGDRSGPRSVLGHSYAFRAKAPGTPLFSTATSPIRRVVVR